MGTRKSLTRRATIPRTKKYGEDAPEMADLYLSYGKALLENAISLASVLGKDAEPAPAEDDKCEQVVYSCCPCY